MSRGLDHIVHAVRDLDAVAHDYEALGFTVGPRNRHPFGTHNRIVQFPGFFIELLAVVESEKIAPATPRTPSFGVFNREFLAEREGFSMLVLESQDAEADAVAFREAGIGDFDPFRFERDATLANGETARVAFSIAFAKDAAPARAGFFTCRQHNPENFWNPAFQRHANAAATPGGVVLVAENPTDHHIFLSAFVGERDLLATSTGITVPTSRGTIQVMDPAAYRIHFNATPPSIAAGLTLAALRFEVADLATTRDVLARSGKPLVERMGRLVVPPEALHGAALIFEKPER